MKITLAIIATALAFYSYIPYFRNIFARKTKPHAFSWLIWSLLTGIAFVAQLSNGGGAGSWVSGFTAIVCFVIFLLALKYGEKHIVRIDWVFLFGAFGAMALWAITEDALLAVILITIIDALGFAPTFRKSFHKPNEETALTYGLSAVKFAIAIAALENLSVVTVLYPLSLVVMNGAFVVMVLVRRKQLLINAERPY